MLFSMDRNILMQKFFQSAEALKRSIMLCYTGEQWPDKLPPRAQLAVLFNVAFSGTESIKEIAQQFGMTSSAATQLVNALVANGLLKRQADTNDRRKVLVALTSDGKTVLLEAKKRRRKHMTEVLGALSDTELETLIRLQEKITSHRRNV